MAGRELSQETLQVIEDPNLSHDSKVKWIQRCGTEKVECMIALTNWEKSNLVAPQREAPQSTQLSYEELLNLASSLQQVFREKQNAKNEMRPKKQHPGYKFEAEQFAQNGKVAVRRFKYITTYPNTFNYEAALTAVTLDFNNGLLLTKPANVPFKLGLAAGNKGLYEVQITIDEKYRPQITIPDTVRYFELKPKSRRQQRAEKSKKKTAASAASETADEDALMSLLQS